MTDSPIRIQRQNLNQPETQEPAFSVQDITQGLERLTGEEASGRLRVLQEAEAEGLISPAESRLIAGDLERAIANDVQANAPMSHTARRRRSSRLEQAAANAWHSAVGVSLERRPQAFMDSLRTQLGGDTAVRGLLLRTPPAAMDEMIMGAGATNEQARGIRNFVGRHFARQFERDVQNQVLNEVTNTRAEFQAAIQDDGALDAAIEGFVGPGSGQDFLRALGVLGVDARDQLSSLYNRIGRHPSKRAAVLEELRAPFRDALQEVVGHLDQAAEDVSNHFSDRIGSAFTTYTTATRQTAREWGLPRNINVRTAQYGSVIAHAIRERMVDTTGEREFDAAIASVAKFGISLIGGRVATFVNAAVGVGGNAVAAERQAALATAGVGDVGQAEEQQANAEVQVMRTAFGQVRSGVTRPMTDAVNGLAPADGTGRWLVRTTQGQVRRLGRQLHRNENAADAVREGD